MKQTEHSEDLCCTDERTGQRSLVPVDEAVSRALALASPVDGIEIVGLEDAIGRVLADDLFAPFPLPSFDNSAMDGYALRSEDFTGDGPWAFFVAGRVAAGEDAAHAGVVEAGRHSGYLRVPEYRLAQMPS